MIFKPSKKLGFTVVELLVVIVVIGVLSTVTVVSYRGIQKDARDSERETDVQIIMASLERFYNEKGYYPGGTTVSGSNTSAFFTNHLDVPVQSITAPQGTTIFYTTSNVASEVFRIDRYSYRPSTSADGTCLNTTTSNTCARYQIRYKTEASNTDINSTSRYGW